MTGEEKCWFCRRTIKEILQQAEKDGMTTHFGKNQLLEKLNIPEWDYSIYICEICSCILSNKIEDHLTYLTEDGIMKIKLEV